MINILFMVQPGLNGNQESCELFSFLFDNISKFGDLTTYLHQPKNGFHLRHYLLSGRRWLSMQ